jgi:squalene/oxidosqualene cyclase-like protein
MVFRSQQIRNYVAKGGKLPDLTSKPQTVKEAAWKAAHFYSMLQTDDGHWAGDYGGPHFLMPGLIIVWYVMGRPELMLNDEQTKLMELYISVHQQLDGGWGTHIESPSTMFGTTMMYVALRLLGVDEDDPRCQKGRNFIQAQGGAVMTSSWAKFYLCLLGCMEWDAHNSVPSEFWLLPNWFPFHPGRLWCQCRMVYLPMGYLYGIRFVYEKAETDEVVQSLRQELYVQAYNTIRWMKTRHMAADMDNYSPIPPSMKFLQNILACYETWTIFQPIKNYLREYGLQFSLDYMKAEDLQTNFINIGPVNKVLNMLSAFHGK